MRVVFMGTPAFAAESLKSLLASGHEVAGVFTRADKPGKRGNKIEFSPVKQLAAEHGLPLFQPATLRDEQSAAALRQLAPDCIAVAAYGLLLPREVLELPRYGCLNVHASLLPKYRGAAPINRCIMNGEKESGITIMQMDAGLDTGDILLTESTPIDENTTATALHDKLAEIGGRLLVKALNNIDSLTPVKQDDGAATYADKIRKEECEIDFSRSAEEICAFVRGLADYPCAYAFHEGRRLKVYRAVAGTVGGLAFKCGERGGETVALTEVQPAGGKRMRAEEYLRGLRK